MTKTEIDKFGMRIINDYRGGSEYRPLVWIEFGRLAGNGNFARGCYPPKGYLQPYQIISSEKGRYLVEECLQPGFGTDEWNEVGRYESKSGALMVADLAGHGYSRSVYDTMGECVVRQGWRIE